MTIDPESKKFMAHTKKHLSSKEDYKLAVAQVRTMLDAFYEQPRKQVIDKLMFKLEKGAHEHGAPVYTPQQLKVEMENELIDLLGWWMVKVWQRERNG